MNKQQPFRLNNCCHIHLCANHAVVIWLFPAGKLEQVFWAPKMHMLLRSKVLSGHKRAKSRGTSEAATKKKHQPHPFPQKPLVTWKVECPQSQCHGPQGITCEGAGSKSCHPYHRSSASEDKLIGCIIVLEHSKKMDQIDMSHWPLSWPWSSPNSTRKLGSGGSSRTSVPIQSPPPLRAGPSKISQGEAIKTKMFGIIWEFVLGCFGDCSGTWDCLG